MPIEQPHVFPYLLNKLSYFYKIHNHGFQSRNVPQEQLTLELRFLLDEFLLLRFQDSKRRPHLTPHHSHLQENLGNGIKWMPLDDSPFGMPMEGEKLVQMERRDGNAIGQWAFSEAVIPVCSCCLCCCIQNSENVLSEMGIINRRINAGFIGEPGQRNDFQMSSNIEGSWYSSIL